MMRKRMLGTALVLTMALGLGAVAGCSSQEASAVNADTPEGVPPIMPVTHEGRFESLGANGCYGCHGANEQANPMLNGSVALPDDHYTGGDPSSLEMDATHGQCNTCHAQAQG